MLSLHDCIAFSGLTPDQLDAIAHHKHLPEVIAAEWAETILDSADGVAVVEAALIEEVGFACEHGDCGCAERYRRGLEEFRRTHAH